MDNDIIECVASLVAKHANDKKVKEKSIQVSCPNTVKQKAVKFITL